MKITYPAVEPIMAWQTGDGKIFDNETAARKHDCQLRLVASMEQIPWREPDSDDILQWMLDNKDLVREAIAMLGDTK